MNKEPKLIGIIEGFKTERECLKNYCERLLLIEENQERSLTISAETLLDDLIRDAKITLANLKSAPQSQDQ